MVSSVYPEPGFVIPTRHPPRLAEGSNHGIVTKMHPSVARHGGTSRLRVTFSSDSDLVGIHLFWYN